MSDVIQNKGVIRTLNSGGAACTSRSMSMVLPAGGEKSSIESRLRAGAPIYGVKYGVLFCMARAVGQDVLWVGTHFCPE